MESEFRLIEKSLREMTAELLHAEKKLNEKTDFNDSAAINNDCNENCNNLLNNTTNESKKLITNQTNDRFIIVVKNFLEQAKNELHQIQILHREMEKKVLKKTFIIELSELFYCFSFWIQPNYMLKRHQKN